jgi:hypothetical protein
MKARIARRLARDAAKGQETLLIPLDDATAACRFQAAAHGGRGFRRRERSHHGTVVCAFLAEVGAADAGVMTAELARIFGL